MAYECDLDELEILPDGTPHIQSKLFQTTSAKTDLYKSPTKSNLYQGQQSPSNLKPRRRLFQNRGSPQREFPEDDSENYLGAIELNFIPDAPQNNKQKKKPREVPTSTLIVEGRQQQLEKKTEEDWTRREKQTIDNVLKKQTTKVYASNTDKLPNGYQIYKDFNCMLNLTDINYGVKGNNKFYQIQILHQEQQNFTVYTKWGRIGAENPGTQMQDVESRLEAIQQFKKKFAHKTQQQWDDREKFIQQAGKYNLTNVTRVGQQDSVNDDVERLNKRNLILSQKIKNNVSKLQPDLRDLMASIYDIGQMQRTLKELNIDTEKNPLGRLSSEQIMKGYRVLKEIQNQLKNNRCKEKVLGDLSNLFYTNIPQNYGYKKPPTINNDQTLREKVQLLDILRELDVANKYMIIATNEQVLIQQRQQNTDQNPLDMFYELLKCDIRVLEDMDMFRTIKDAVQSTHGLTHQFKLQVMNIFDVERKEEKFRYFPFNKLNNKKLLWHGSRTNNYVGILSEGLRIAPPDAPSSGYMFGKGAYFTDVCSKSAQYCQSSSSNSEGLILLCEVALGNMYKVFKPKTFAQAPLHYHSVHGVGRNMCDPKLSIKLQNEVHFDVGQIVVNEDLTLQNIDSDLIYNEYIVYDVAQVKIKYMIKVKFSSNKGIL